MYRDILRGKGFQDTSNDRRFVRSELDALWFNASLQFVVETFYGPCWKSTRPYRDCRGGCSRADTCESVMDGVEERMKRVT